MRLRDLAVVVAAALLAAACSSKPSMLMEPNSRQVPPDRPAPRQLRSNERADPQRAAETNVGLARGYLERGEPEVALQRLNRALELDPGSADAHTMIAVVYEQVGRPHLAERHYERATRLAPNDGGVLNNYGAWLCRNGRAAEADAWFARALDDPFYRSPGAALANAGACALQAGNQARAEEYFRRAVELRPDDAHALEQLARLSYARGEYLSARAFIERRKGAGPATADTLELGGRIEEALGDMRAAQRYRERLRTEFPEHNATVPGG
ncbi:type IV pilus biogenesis/stability protein PilW [Coralloluteibacterium thermophilus]|uniref:Type IV pilus biogenesis/stability protein PilW n=1 Tax=Coralloluteibacterium thermophilum TaxID=2707049 RepID=A0ABV9NI70_9GAMM